MTQSPDPDIRPALAALSSALAALDRPAMLIGGLAVIARGVPRLTIDIDAVVHAEGLDVDRLWAVLRDSGLEARVADAAQIARERLVLLLRHHAEMNFQRIRTTLAQFFEVLEIPERLAEFDRLVSEAIQDK